MHNGGVAQIAFGPAGWSYRDWEGIVYPRSRPRGFHPAAALARYFDVIELNSPFYRTPAPQLAQGWVRRVREVNPRFRFTTKLLQSFTHQRNASAQDESEVRAYLDCLASDNCLGAVLLQFPWSCRYTSENLDFVSELHRRFREYPAALEVRHGSWENDEAQKRLRDEGIGLCNIDQPVIGDSLPPTEFVTATVAYVRLHGRNYERWFQSSGAEDQRIRHIVAAQTQGRSIPATERTGSGTDPDFVRPDAENRRYDYLYTQAEIDDWAARVQRISERAQITYVIANNHFEGKAVVNSLQLSHIVLGRTFDLAPELVSRYPKLRAISSTPQTALF
jgi:uncharacterized protein YecE (DUF72 family)